MTDSSSHPSPTPPNHPDDFDDKTQVIGELEVFTRMPQAKTPEKTGQNADKLLEPDSKIQASSSENSSVQSVVQASSLQSGPPHSQGHGANALSAAVQDSTASAQIETMDESASSDRAVATDEKTTGSDETLISQQPPIKLSGSSFLLKQEGSEGASPITLPSNFPTDEALPPGTTLGHFRITQYIGGGGMGRVYEAIDLALDRKVAIKLLPHQRAQDQTSVARFLNEARSAARLNHEHIAQVYFCGQESGIPFIAFEYVEGINVRDYVIANGPLPLPRAINFLLQTADALAHAAACGVIHRDIKPSNILITPEGKAKLIDMGLARLLKPSDPDDELTASGVTLGTFDYISPEQARDPRDADIRSDIYSLGCTFFFMLTGRPPFPEGTVLQKLLKHQGDTPPDVRDLKPDLPEEVSAVIRKMMAKNPKDRFQHPRLLMDTVMRIAEMIGLTPPAPGETTWRIPEPVRVNRLYRHLPWIIVVSLLCLITLAYHYFSKSEQESILPELPSAPRGIPSGLDATAPVPTLPVPSEPKTVKSQTEPEGQDLPPSGRLLDKSENVLLTPRVLTDQILSASMTGRLRQLPTSDGAKLGAEFNLIDVPGTGIPQRLAGGFDVEPISSSDVLGPLRSQGRDPSDLEYLSLLFGDPNRAAMFQWFRAATLRNTPSPAPVHSFPTAAVNSVSLVVDRVGKAPGSYATLQAALSAAYNLGKNGRSGDTPEIQIELRFSGILEVPLITLVSQKVSLVAATGYKPVLTYKPTETVSGG
ncbi:MAG: serine/threonine-protein kinase, partial [Planctomycetia bacterium]|nr:serine/threonine-protein kinase [Planctomycetia bacterium]